MYNCGVFAIAFATALANGQSPGRYIFEQDAVRAGTEHHYVSNQEDKAQQTEGQEHHQPQYSLQVQNAGDSRSDNDRMLKLQDLVSC